MSSLEKLNHVSKKIKGGGEVIVLDTGAVIDAEAEAMLQALHSRSTEGLRGHLEILAKRGPENFMANFYVGYGHKSIGDCGSVTLFIEGVSMLAAKAIQDWPLYSGQESSTRYLDFASQPFISPIKTKKARETQETLRQFYTENIEAIKASLKVRFPIEKGQKESVYEKAINARAFDIMRAFLPAGASTNLAWHSNLRQAADKIMQLRHHPLKEVRYIADALEKALKEAYPSSFGHKKYKETEEYIALTMQRYYYHNKKCPDCAMTRCDINNALIDPKTRKLLKARPNGKTELPKHISGVANFTFEFQLDFGSFRDIQRHRSLVQRMPLLTMDLGFEDWYMSELPETVRKNARKMLKEHKKTLKGLGASPEELQYYIPMGYKVANLVTGTLPAWVYTAELRSSSSVHPTLRRIALQVLEQIEEKMKPYGLKTFPDKSTHPFETERGKHDIELK